MVHTVYDPQPSKENNGAKILWDINPWQLEKCSKDCANKPDISILDKKNKEWSLVEGMIHTPGTLLLKEPSTNRTSIQVTKSLAYHHSI